MTTFIKADILADLWPGAFRCVLMQRKKAFSRDLREATVGAHSSPEGYKVISKQYEVHHSIVYKLIHK